MARKGVTLGCLGILVIAAIVPDAFASRIINDSLVPKLREGDNDGAVRAAVSSLLERISQGDEGIPAEEDPNQGKPVVSDIIIMGELLDDSQTFP